MTTTQTTAQAAKTAGVTVATIRAWARYGAITATKTAAGWVIDEASLRHRIALGRRSVAKQLAAFADAKAAQAKAVELVELGALIPLDRSRYLAVSSSGGDGYVVDVLEGSCTCRGYVYGAHCYHLVAAEMLQTRTADRAYERDEYMYDLLIGNFA